MLDPQGCVATWNAGAQKIKGYTKDEILGRQFLGVLSRGCRKSTLAGARARACAGARTLRGRGLARAQGRHAILGQRRHCADSRRGEVSARLREDHARSDGAKAGRGTATRRAPGERVPGNALARIAQSARADPERARCAGAQARRPRRSALGTRGDRKTGAATVAPRRRLARRQPDHARENRAQARIRRFSPVGGAGRRSHEPDHGRASAGGRIDVARRADADSRGSHAPRADHREPHEQCEQIHARRGPHSGAGRDDRPDRLGHGGRRRRRNVGRIAASHIRYLRSG